MRPLQISLMLILATLPALVPPVQAQDEYTLSHQGLLLKTGGVPVDSTLPMTFKFYKNGAEVWSETHAFVDVADGSYEVALGSLTPFDTVSFDAPIELGITVGGDSELNPRQTLRASPRALTLQNFRVRRVQTAIAGGAVNIIGGHDLNSDSTGVDGATISGGGRSSGPNKIVADYGTIGGGIANRVAGAAATIGGGSTNVAGGTGSVVSGGSGNVANGSSSTVAGGFGGTASGDYSSVGGGHSNVAGLLYATVAGGYDNEANGNMAVVSGGTANLAKATRATVSGGEDNHARGAYSAVPGGFGNRARGGKSFAAGSYAKANFDGSFVWSDATATSTDTIASTAANQFLIRAAGGVGIGTNSPDGHLHVAGTNIGVSSGDVERDDIVIEDADAILGLYSDNDGTWASGIVMGELNDLGLLVDKWAIVRETSGSGSDLHFRFGTGQDYVNATTNFAITDLGNVFVTGDLDVGDMLTKAGGTFKIDHPLDPLNKYLYHSFVESPDMMNLYNGNVMLDAAGEAVVTMPGYFEALNRDFRYQLTCIGGYAPVYVAEEIDGGSFRIAGGSPGLKVSWTVTGVRKDPYAELHRVVPEVEKPVAEKGTYLHPDAYGRDVVISH